MERAWQSPRDVAGHQAGRPQLVRIQVAGQAGPWTPRHAASSAGLPCATSAAMAPVSTSPMPAVAIPRLPVEFTRVWPGGAALTVGAPFSTTMQSNEKTSHACGSHTTPAPRLLAIRFPLAPSPNRPPRRVRARAMAACGPASRPSPCPSPRRRAPPGGHPSPPRPPRAVVAQPGASGAAPHQYDAASLPLHAAARRRVAARRATHA